MHLRLCAVVLLLIAVLAAQNAAQQVSSGEAERNLVKHVDATTPPLAKVARIGGKVVLRIAISSAGDVSQVNVISGHPMLVNAAIAAVKQWKYRPFVENGSPVPVETKVTVDFPGGMSEEEAATRNKFFPQEEKCRTVLNAGKYTDAERECRNAVEISNALPQEVVLERSGARTLLAHSLFLQGRVAEAIPWYEQALDLDKGYRKPNDADLATDYANLGRAYAKSGELAKADRLYDTALKTYEAAIQDLPSMKDNYTNRLIRTLNEYAKIKDAEDQKSAADELRAKAKALAR